MMAAARATGVRFGLGSGVPGGSRVVCPACGGENEAGRRFCGDCGTRLVAVVSKPALFLFQNMEYSCIHSGAGFGRLEPGQSGEAVTRLYFVQGAVEQWRDRMLAEMG